MAVLPYLYTAKLVADDGSTILAEVPVSIWPASAQQMAAAAVVHDHRGEAPLQHAGVNLAFELRFPNRRLKVTQGPLRGTYTIAGAVPHTLLPHVALELKKAGL